MRMHKSITVERLLGLVEADDYMGVCIACGQEVEGIEPDARKYTCENEACGLPKVYGVQELAIMCF